MRHIPLITGRDARRLVTFPNLEIRSDAVAFSRGRETALGGGRAVINAIAQAVVFRPDGTVADYREFQARSFLANFLASWYAGFTQQNAAYTAPSFPDGTWSWYDTGGTKHTWAAANNQGGNNTSYAVASNEGLVIGTGTNSATPSDSQLQSVITHGSGAGQMFLLDNMVFKGPTTEWPSAGQTGFVIQRFAYNNSGADITVSEMGLGYYDVSFNSMMLVMRDLISTPLLVPDGGTIAWGYTIYAALDAVFDLVALIENQFAYYYPYRDLGNRQTGSYWLQKQDGSWGDTSTFGAGGWGNAIGGTGAASGILLGTGTTAPTTADYKLAAAIANGTGTGELSYQAQATDQTLTVSGQGTSFSFQRAVINQSTAAVTPTEHGLMLSWGAYLTHALINGGTGYTLNTNDQMTSYFTVSIIT